MKKILKIAKVKIFITLIILFSFNYSPAQSKVGTTIGQFLKIEPSARSAAMANAGTSLSGEASMVFYNPASLGRLNITDVQFTHSQWLADINYNYAAIGVPVSGIGTLSLQATSLGSGEIDVRTVDQPLGTGERYSVTDFALGLGYGLMLTDRVSIGILVNYFSETIWHSSLSGFGINLGVQYEVSNKGLTIAASLLNFGPRTGYNGRDLFVDYDFNAQIHGNNDQLPAEFRTDTYPLPTTFRVGLSYPISFGENNVVTLAADAMHPNDSDERVNVGAEWMFMNNFALRAGYRDLFLPDSEGGLVFGAGVKVGFGDTYNIRFDYAWADYGRLDQTHRFTVGLGF